MNTTFKDWLLAWDKAYIRDADLTVFFQENHQKRYDAVKYALRQGYLKSIRRGLYLITFAHKTPKYDTFELAQVIYGPSYVSVESALSYYGWIPEMVYTTTSATARRSKQFQTEIGNYHYYHVPQHSFYQHVDRVKSADSIFLIATPWKALADYSYVHKKTWHSLEALYQDLRIEKADILASDLTCLQSLSIIYHAKRVRMVLSHLLKEIQG